MNLSIAKLAHNEKAPMELLFKSDPSEEMINKYLYSGDCYLAKIDDELAGVFVLLPITHEEIELKNISIVETFQSQGVGTEILKYAIRVSKLEGFQYLIAKTADSSKDGINFYQKLKFEHYFTVKSHFIKYYNHPIMEDGVQAVDQLVFRRKL